jgi:hypothetical protein
MLKISRIFLFFLIWLIVSDLNAANVRVSSAPVGPPLEKSYVDDLDREVTLFDLDGDAVIDMLVITDSDGRRRTAWSQSSSLTWTDQQGNISEEYFRNFTGSLRTGEQEEEIFSEINVGFFQRRFALISEEPKKTESDFFPALTEVEAQEVLLGIFNEKQVKSSCFILGLPENSAEKILVFALPYVNDVSFLRELYAFYSERQFSGARQVELAIKAKTPKKRRSRLREIGKAYFDLKSPALIG